MPKNELVVAFELGGSSIKMVAVQPREKPEIILWDIEELPLTEPGKKPDYLDVMLKLVKKHSINSRNIRILLTQPGYSIQILKLPVMSDKNLVQTIQWEMTSRVSFNIADAEIGYVISDKIEEEGIEKLELIVCVSEKTVIAQIIQTEIKPVSIVPDTLCLISILPQEPVVCSLNIRSKTTSINIVDTGKLKFTRNLLIGGDTFTEALSQLTNTTFQQAEATKKIDGLDFEAAFVKPIARRFVNEIKRSLDYFYKASPQKTIECILLTGGGSLLKNLDSYLHQNLQINIKHLSSPELTLQNIREEFPFQRLSSTIGACTKDIDINLLPDKSKKNKVVFNSNLVYTVLIVSVFLLCGYSIFFLPKKMLKSYKTKIENSKTLITSKELKIKKIENSVADTIVDKLVSENKMFLPAIKVISKTPPGLTLDKIKVSKKGIELKGITQNNNAVYAYIANLKHSDCIKSTKLKHSQKVAKRICFELSCNF